MERTLICQIIGIIALLAPISAAPSVSESYYCGDYASEERTNIRFSFEDIGVHKGCEGCRKAYIDVLVYNHTTNKSYGDYAMIWYTLTNTVSGFKVVIQPGRYIKRIKRLLGRLNLSSTIWDDGLPFMPGSPFGEDSLIIPVTKDVNATLTYSNCARGLTRNQAHTGYCNLPTSPLLSDIRLQFAANDCSPFIGRLDFLQEMSGSSALETIGTIGWQFHGTESHSKITLFKAYGTDLSKFLSIESLGNDSVVRTYSYWLNSASIWYDFQFDKVFVNSSKTVEFSPCPK